MNFVVKQQATQHATPPMQCQVGVVVVDKCHVVGAFVDNKNAYHLNKALHKPLRLIVGRIRRSLQYFLEALILQYFEK